MQTPPEARHQPVHHHAAWRVRLEDNAPLLLGYRLLVGLAGAVCMVGAILTGWLPGPGGIPLFMLGLWVWSTEFAWAHGLMLWFKGWLDRYLALPARTRQLFVAGCLLAAVCCWYGWAAWQGLPGWLPATVRERLAHLPLLD